MIDALSLLQVSMKAQPHHTHKFGRKLSTTVHCASNDRFGTVRVCKGCGSREVWAGGAGSHYFEDLFLNLSCVTNLKRQARSRNKKPDPIMIEC